MTDTPERLARRETDARLEAAGWRVQDRREMDLTAGRGVAVREFPLRSGFGFADYLLYVDRLVAGVIEAKVASTLTGVEAQSAKYSQGVPDNFSVHDRPLPYLFESNGAVTCFTNLRDPTPRSRPVFHFPRPETLADWLEQPETLRSRLKKLPELDEARLWSAQARAIRNLEASLGRGRPRALVQMATGSGKTFTAVNAAYRLLKHGGAKRILFLVDRSNLGRQTYDEFANFQPPDDARKFPELYTVQRLTANAVNPAAKVVVTTVQRLYSMLRGEVEYDAGNEERSAFDSAGPWAGEPPRVEYNAVLPPEFFDFVVVDVRNKLTRAEQGLDLAKLSDGSNVPQINHPHIAPCLIPLAPVAEQEAIVAAVQAQLSVIEQLEADIDAKLQFAQALRQSILKHAFTGKLVPQYPDDEPASELLQRIAAERKARVQEAAAAKRRRLASRRSRK